MNSLSLDYGSTLPKFMELLKNRSKREYMNILKKYSYSYILVLPYPYFLGKISG